MFEGQETQGSFLWIPAEILSLKKYIMPVLSKFAEFANLFKEPTGKEAGAQIQHARALEVGEIR